MVSSVSGSNFYQFRPEMQESVNLTDDQKSAVEEIVSKYDSENMSASDMKSMMDEIKDLGFGSSEDVKSILDDAGFEPPKDVPPPPDGEGNGPQVNDADVPDFVTEFLEKQQSGEVSQEDYYQLVQNLKNLDKTTNGFFIDKSV